jgi:regulation of enolase protein 1 (concanavalin A-like superfamily)
LPSPWQHQDVGTVGIAGSASVNGGVFTVRGEGSNIWGYADSFHFVEQPIGGDVTIVARVTSVQDTEAIAKAGVMLRASTAADAAHVILDVLPGGDIELMTRPSAGQATTYVTGMHQPTPVWLRLVRTGTTVTASTSADGTTWTTVGATTLDIGANALVGLVVCSAAAQTLNTSTFDSITVGAGSYSSAAPGSASDDHAIGPR